MNQKTNSVCSKKRTNIRLKITAILVLICFVSTSVWAEPGVSTQRIFPSLRSEAGTLQQGLEFSIPETLGRLEVQQVPKSTRPNTQTPVMIHLEDAHASLSAQQNISEILRYLNQQYGVSLVLLEGGAGRLDPTRLKQFQKPSLNRLLVQTLVKEGEVGGAEFFLSEHAMAPHTIQAFGVEEETLYWKNLRSYRRTLAGKREAYRFLEDVKQGLMTLGSHYANPRLRDFLKEWMFYQETRGEMSRHLNALMRAAKNEIGLDFSEVSNQIEYPCLVRLFKIQQAEKALDLEKSEAEKKKLAQWLQEKSLGLQWMSGMEAILSDKLESTEVEAIQHPRKLMETFYETVRPYGFEFSDYPHWFSRLASRILAQEIEPDLLSNETKKLTSLILDQLVQTQEEKKLTALLKDYLLIKKLFLLELSCDDFDAVRSRTKELQPQVMLKRMRAFQSSRVRLDLGESRSADELFKTAVSFYQGALERDSALARNAKKIMKQTRQNRAVLITGGFHSKGLERAWKKQQAAYFRIRPRITQREGDRLDYEKVMNFSDEARTASLSARGREIKSPLYLASQPAWIRGRQENRIAVAIQSILALEPRTELRSIPREKELQPEPEDLSQHPALEVIRNYYLARRQLMESLRVGDDLAYRTALRQCDQAASQTKNQTKDSAEIQKLVRFLSQNENVQKELMIADPLEITRVHKEEFSEKEKSQIHQVLEKVMTAMGFDDKELQADLVRKSELVVYPLTLRNLMPSTIEGYEFDPMALRDFLEVLQHFFHVGEGGVGGSFLRASVLESDRAIFVDRKRDFNKTLSSMAHEVIHFLASEDVLPFDVSREMVPHAVEVYLDLQTGVFQTFLDNIPDEKFRMFYNRILEDAVQDAKKGGPLMKPSSLLNGMKKRILDEIPEIQAQPLFNLEDYADRMSGFYAGAYAWEQERSRLVENGLELVFAYAKKNLPRRRSHTRVRRLTSQETRYVSRIADQLRPIPRIMLSDDRMTPRTARDLQSLDHTRWFYDPEDGGLRYVPQDILDYGLEGARGLTIQEVFRNLFSNQGLIEPGHDHIPFRLIYGLCETTRFTAQGLSRNPGRVPDIETFYRKKLRILDLEMEKERMAAEPRFVQLIEALFYQMALTTDPQSPKQDPRMTDEMVRNAVKDIFEILISVLNRDAQAFYETVRDQVWPLAERLLEEDKQGAIQEELAHEALNKMIEDGEFEIEPESSMPPVTPPGPMPEQPQGSPPINESETPEMSPPSSPDSEQPDPFEMPPMPEMPDMPMPQMHSMPPQGGGQGQGQGQSSSSTSGNQMNSPSGQSSSQTRQPQIPPNGQKLKLTPGPAGRDGIDPKDLSPKARQMLEKKMREMQEKMDAAAKEALEKRAKEKLGEALDQTASEMSDITGDPVPGQKEAMKQRQNKTPQGKGAQGSPGNLGDSESGLDPQEMKQKIEDLKKTATQINEQAGQISESANQASQAAGKAGGAAKEIDEQGASASLKSGEELEQMIQDIVNQVRELRKQAAHFKDVSDEIRAGTDSVGQDGRISEATRDTMDQQTGEINRLADEMEKDAADADKALREAGASGQELKDILWERQNRVEGIKGRAKNIQEKLGQTQSNLEEIRNESENAGEEANSFQKSVDRAHEETLASPVPEVSQGSGDPRSGGSPGDPGAHIQERGISPNNFEEELKPKPLGPSAGEPRKKHAFDPEFAKRLADAFKALPDIPFPDPGKNQRSLNQAVRALTGLTDEQRRAMAMIMKEIAPYQATVKKAFLKEFLKVEEPEEERKLTKPRLDSRRLALVPAGVTTVFKRRNDPAEAKLRISYLVDGSGSMFTDSHRFDFPQISQEMVQAQNRINQAVKMAILLMKTFQNERHVELEIGIHATQQKIIFSFGDRITEAEIYRVAAAILNHGLGTANSDLAGLRMMMESLREYEKKAGRSPAVLITLADGGINYSDRAGIEEILTSNPDIIFMPAGIGPESRSVAEAYAPQGRAFEDLGKFIQAMTQWLKASARKIKKFYQAGLGMLLIGGWMGFLAFSGDTILNSQRPRDYQSLSQSSIASPEGSNNVLDTYRQELRVMSALAIKPETENFRYVAERVKKKPGAEASATFLMRKNGINPRFKFRIYEDGEKTPKEDVLELPYNVEKITEIIEGMELQRLERGVLVLEGEAGTGKNTLVYYAHKLLGKQFFFMAGHHDIDEDDLVERRGVNEKEQGKTGWIPSPIVEAMMTGGTVFIDEFNKLKPKVFSKLNSILQDRRVVLHDGTIVDAAQGFIKRPRSNVIESIPKTFSIILGANPIAGANDEDVYKVHPVSFEAQDRVHRIFVDYLPPDQEKKLLQWHFSKARAQALREGVANEMTEPDLNAMKNILNRLVNMAGAMRLRYFGKDPSADGTSIGRGKLIARPLSTRVLMNIAEYLAYFPEESKRMKAVIRKFYSYEWEEEMRMQNVQTLIDNQFTADTDYVFSEEDQKGPRYVTENGKRYFEFAGVRIETGPDAPLSLEDIPWDMRITWGNTNLEYLRQNMMDLKLGRHMLFTGEMGTAKSMVANYLTYAIYGLDVETLSVTRGATAEDLIAYLGLGEGEKADSSGRMTAVGKNETGLVHAYVVRAMIKGVPVILDEISKGKPEVMAVLNNILQFGWIDLANGQRIYAKKGFCIIATRNPDSNSGYIGNEALSGEFTDRWSHYTMKYLDLAEEAAVYKEFNDYLRDEVEDFPFVRLKDGFLQKLAVFVSLLRKDNRLPRPVSMRGAKRIIVRLAHDPDQYSNLRELIRSAFYYEDTIYDPVVDELVTQAELEGMDSIAEIPAPTVEEILEAGSPEQRFLKFRDLLASFSGPDGMSTYQFVLGSSSQHNQTSRVPNNFGAGQAHTVIAAVSYELVQVIHRILRDWEFSSREAETLNELFARLYTPAPKILLEREDLKALLEVMIESGPPGNPVDVTAESNLEILLTHLDRISFEKEEEHQNFLQLLEWIQNNKFYSECARSLASQIAEGFDQKGIRMPKHLFGFVHETLPLLLPSRRAAVYPFSEWIQDLKNRLPARAGELRSALDWFPDGAISKVTFGKNWPDGMGVMPGNDNQTLVLDQKMDEVPLEEMEHDFLNALKALMLVHLAGVLMFREKGGEQDEYPVEFMSSVIFGLDLRLWEVLPDEVRRGILGLKEGLKRQGFERTASWIEMLEALCKQPRMLQPETIFKQVSMFFDQLENVFWPEDIPRWIQTFYPAFQQEFPNEDLGHVSAFEKGHEKTNNAFELCVKKLFWKQELVLLFRNKGTGEVIASAEIPAGDFLGSVSGGKLFFYQLPSKFRVVLEGHSSDIWNHLSGIMGPDWKFVLELSKNWDKSSHALEPGPDAAVFYRSGGLSEKQSVTSMKKGAAINVDPWAQHKHLDIRVIPKEEASIRFWKVALFTVAEGQDTKIEKEVLSAEIEPSDFRGRQNDGKLVFRKFPDSLRYALARANLNVYDWIVEEKAGAVNANIIFKGALKNESTESVFIVRVISAHSEGKLMVILEQCGEPVRFEKGVVPMMEGLRIFNGKKLLEFEINGDDYVGTEMLTKGITRLIFRGKCPERLEMEINRIMNPLKNGFSVHVGTLDVRLPDSSNGGGLFKQNTSESSPPNKPRTELRVFKMNERLTHAWSNVTRDLFGGIGDRDAVASLGVKARQTLLELLKPRAIGRAGTISEKALPEDLRKFLSRIPVRRDFGISVVSADTYGVQDLEASKVILDRFPNKMQVVVVKNIGEQEVAEINRLSEEILDGRIWVVRENSGGYLGTVDALFRGDRKQVPKISKFLEAAQVLSKRGGIGARLKLTGLLAYTCVVMTDQASLDPFPGLGLIRTRLLNDRVEPVLRAASLGGETSQVRLGLESVLSMVTAGQAALDVSLLGQEWIRHLDRISQNAAGHYSAWILPQTDFLQAIALLQQSTKRLLASA